MLSSAVDLTLSAAQEPGSVADSLWSNTNAWFGNRVACTAAEGTLFSRHQRKVGVIRPTYASTWSVNSKLPGLGVRTLFPLLVKGSISLFARLVGGFIRCPDVGDAAVHPATGDRRRRKELPCLYPRSRLEMVGPKDGGTGGASGVTSATAPGVWRDSEGMSKAGFGTRMV